MVIIFPPNSGISCNLVVALPCLVNFVCLSLGVEASILLKASIVALLWAGVVEEVVNLAGLKE